MFTRSRGTWVWLTDRLGGLRIMGVLQRIGVVYLLCSLFFIKTGPRVWIAVCLLSLLGYWAALTLVPVPVSGFGALIIRPNLEPETNLAAWIDRALLTQDHLYKHAAFDPEGPFSTLSAVSTGLMGVLAGYHLKRGLSTPGRRATQVLMAGVAAAIVGLLWAVWFPLNKQLWTGSYALFTGGLAATFLAAGYWLIDIQGLRRYAPPFVAFGVNAITAFWGSGLMVRAMGLWPLEFQGRPYGLKDYFYQRWIGPQFSSPNFASLVGGLLFVALWWGIMAVMYRRQWIIKV